MTFDEMVDAAIAGKLKAMIVVGDNPLMFAPGRARVEQALAALDVLDRHRQPADRHGEGRARRLRRRARRTARPARTPTPSGASTACTPRSTRSATRARRCSRSPTSRTPSAAPDTWTYAHPDAVTDEIAATVAGYEPFRASSRHLGQDARSVAAVEGRAAARRGAKTTIGERRAAAHDGPHALHEPRRRGGPRAGRRQAAPRGVRRDPPGRRRRPARQGRR